MNKTRVIWVTAAIAASLVVVGCGGGGDDGPAPVATSVPDSAGASVASFLNFIQSLSATDETSEPLTISDAFAVPPDEDDDGILLT